MRLDDCSNLEGMRSTNDSSFGLLYSSLNEITTEMEQGSPPISRILTSSILTFSPPLLAVVTPALSLCSTNVYH